MVLGPENFVHPGFGSLGISVSVKIPKPILEAARIAPSLAHEFPKYAHEFQKETARVEGVADAVNTTVQTIGIAVIFGGVIIALLMREKPKK